MPIRLTDDELEAVMAAARPVAVDRSDAFLQQIASYRKIGPGLVYRVVAQMQRRYFGSSRPMPLPGGVAAGCGVETE